MDPPSAAASVIAVVPAAKSKIHQGFGPVGGCQRRALKGLSDLLGEVVSSRMNESFGPFQTLRSHSHKTVATATEM